MKYLLILPISLLLTFCSAPKGALDGQSYKVSIHVEATTSNELLKLEHEYIAWKHPEGFIVLQRMSAVKNKRNYHIIKIRTRSGKKIDYYFNYHLG